MKNLIVLLVVAVFLIGCSKQEESGSEQLGKDIANRIQAPIEKTEDISSKIQDIRAAEHELTE